MGDPLLDAARRAGALVPEDVRALAADLEGEPDAVVAELRRAKPHHFDTPRLTDEELTQAMASRNLADVINGTAPATSTQPRQQPSVDLGAQGRASGVPRPLFADSLGAEVRGMSDREFLFRLRSGELTRRLRER